MDNLFFGTFYLLVQGTSGEDERRRRYIRFSSTAARSTKG